MNKIKGLLSIILYLFLRIGANRGIKRTYQSQQLQTHNLPNQKIKEPYKLKTYSYNHYYHYVSNYRLSFNYLSNLFKREEFRHHSFITPAAQGLICGLGAKGYVMAIDYLSQS